MVRIVFGFFCFLCLLMAPTLGDACSNVSGTSLERKAIFPGDQSVNVPTNTQLTIHYNYRGPTSGPSAVDFKKAEWKSAWDIMKNVVLREKGGASIKLTLNRENHNEAIRWISVSWKLDKALKPNTTYEVLTGPSNCVPPHCKKSSLKVAATFVTGKLEDKTPPSFQGLGALNVKEEVCNDSCCVVNGKKYDILRFQWKSAQDTHTARPQIRYRIYRANNPSTPLFEVSKTSNTSAWGTGTGSDFLIRTEFACGDARSQAFFLFGVKPMDHLIVRAVDLAGNEDTNTTAQRYTPTCRGPHFAGPGSVDGGTWPQKKRSPGNTSPGQSTSGGGATPPPPNAVGCNVSNTHDSGGWFALLLLFAVFLRRKP